MKTVYIVSALCMCLLAGPAAVAQGAAPANRFASTLVASERFEVGNLLVERHGAASKQAPIIVIPGLASGPWVWQDFIRRFGKDHAIYAVTLPGFDGRPAAAGPQFDKAVDALASLIATRKLERPIVIGHSMGGALALALAERSPGQLRGIASIDGLAVIPGSEQVPAAMRSQMAADMKARMAGGTGSPAQFALQQQQYMRGAGVTDVARADELAKLTAKSDAAAVLDIMADVVAHDLRPGLVKITAPVLLVAPYFEPDAVQRGLTEAMVKDYYASLMAGTPKLTVKTIPQARHFVMFDQPEALEEALAGFIQDL